MRIRFTSLVLVLGVLTAVGLTGCSTSARAALGDGVDVAAMAPKPIARPGLKADIVNTEDGVAELPAAPAPQTVYYSQGARGWNDGCGLPCENGCGDWHVRAVGGWPFIVDPDGDMDGCYYFGADAGYTWPCCWGIDVFFRTFSGESEREVPIAGAPTYLGTDVGEWYTIGVKATWQNSINNSKWFYYAGIGPEFFFTQNYVADDEGFGGFAELGLGYRFNRHWRVRGGVDVHGLITSAAQKNPADDGDDRLVWVFAPVIQVEFNF